MAALAKVYLIKTSLPGNAVVGMVIACVGLLAMILTVAVIKIKAYGDFHLYDESETDRNSERATNITINPLEVIRDNY